LYFGTGTIPRLPRDPFGADNVRGRSALRSKQPKLQPERVMGEVCLGVAVTDIETLVIMGLVLAFTAAN